MSNKETSYRYILNKNKGLMDLLLPLDYEHFYSNTYVLIVGRKDVNALSEHKVNKYIHNGTRDIFIIETLLAVLLCMY